MALSAAARLQRFCDRRLSPFCNLGLGSTLGLKYNVAIGYRITCDWSGWAAFGRKARTTGAVE